MSNLHLQWHNLNKTAILWEHNGPMTWEEIFSFQNRLFEMLDTVDHKVAVVIHPKSTYLPPQALPNLRRLIMTTHHNSGMKIVVRPSRVMRAMFNIAARSHPKLAKKWYFVKNMMQAEKLIASMHIQADSA